jgi:CxxC-x17-CxxC domain-containing protein
MGNFNRDDRGPKKFGNRDGGSRSFDRPSAGRSSFGDRDRPTMHRATCSDCGKSCEVPFKPTGSKPVYCSECFGNNAGGSDRFESRGRDRGNDRGGDRGRDRGGFDEKKMFSATCDGCGETCEVPFRPTSGKPVFCEHCFKKSDSTGMSHSAPRKTESANPALLNEINAKLDLIIRALNTNNKNETVTIVKALEQKEQSAKTKKAKVVEPVVAEIKVAKVKKSASDKKVVAKADKPAKTVKKTAKK